MHGADGLGPHRLCQDGSHCGHQGEARGQGQAGGGRPLHLLPPSICNQKSYGQDHGLSII